MIETLPADLETYAATLTGLVARWDIPSVTAVLLIAEARRKDDEERSIVLSGVPGDSAHSITAPLQLPGRPWHLMVQSSVPLSSDDLAYDVFNAVQLERRGNELQQITAALIDANDQLLALYDLVSSSATSLSRHEVLQTLVDDARRLTDAGAAVIMTQGEVYCSGPTAATSLLGAAASDPANHGRVLRAGPNDRFDLSLHSVGDASDNVMAAASREDRRFTTPQLKLLEAVGDYARGMITLAGVHEQALANAVIERDVATAAALAAQVLPSKAPNIEGLDVVGRCDPARFAAGDFYTYVETGDGLVFIAGDVSGKGLPAALVMTMVSAAATAGVHRERGADPARLLNALSSDVYDYLSDIGVFVTIAVGEWHAGTDRLRIANGGHSPVLLRSAAGVEAIPATAPPLGVLRDMGPDVVEVAFRPGDFLLLGTDGLAEQENAAGDQLGYDDLRRCLGQSRAETSQAMVDELFSLVEDYGKGVAQDDDRTALVVRRREVGA